MVETARETTTDDPDARPHATLDELAAEPERLAAAAATGPVRIERTNGAALVLVDAAAFDRLHHPGRPEVLPIEALSDREIELMDAYPGPADSTEFDGDEPLVWHG